MKRAGTAPLEIGERGALRVWETAEFLGISRSKTYALIAAGELPSVKIGGSRRVPVDVLKRWLAEQSAT